MSAIVNATVVDQPRPIGVGRTIAAVTLGGLVLATGALVLFDPSRRTFAALLLAIAAAAALTLWYLLSRTIAVWEARLDTAQEAEARQAELAQLTAVLDAARGGDLMARGEARSRALTPVVEAANALLQTLADRLGNVGTGTDDLARSAAAIERSSDAMAVGAGRQAASLAEIGRRVQALGARCDEISQLVEVLDDLARQTNVLALNAALEASRAGAPGRGFATVADEVRKLAERSAVASRDIGALTQSVQASATDAGRSLDEMLGLTRTLAEQASQAAGVVGALVETSRQVRTELAPFRVPGQQEAEILRALRGASPELSRALEFLAPLARDADSPLAQAIQRLLAATQAAAASTSLAAPTGASSPPPSQDDARRAAEASARHRATSA